MKKILFLVAIALMPFLASAATLNNSFNIGTIYPVAGGITNVSSTCGVAGSGSSVSFTLVQNGINTPLSTSLPTNSTGAFSGNIAFPSTYGFGQALLVATCNRTNDIINSPLLTFATPAGNSFGLPTVNASAGGIFNVSGSCGNANGSGNANVTLNKNGLAYQLSTFNLSSTGTFSGNLIIPGNISLGQATLTAICSNNTSFSSTINIGPAAVNSFMFNSNPFPGSTNTISGNCTDVNSNANGNVSFEIIRAGTINSLSVNNNQTNSDGYFNSSVFFPANIENSPATFVVTCPNGSTFSNVIMLGATTTPTVLGADLTITPTGGVNAGFGTPNQNTNSVIAGIIFFSGLISLLTFAVKNSYAKN